MKIFIKLTVVPMLVLTMLSSSVIAKGGQEMKGPAQSEAMSSHALAGPAASEAEMMMAETPAPELTAVTEKAATPAKAVAKRAVVADPVSAATSAAPAAAAATSAVIAPVAQKLTLKQKVAKKVMQRMVKRQERRAAKGKSAGGKSQLVAFLLCLFVGGLGIHRFYLGYTGVGILMLLTGGLFGILWLIDFIRIIVGDLEPKNGSYTDTF